MYYLVAYPLDLSCCAFLFQLTLSFFSKLPRSNLSKNQKDAVRNLRTDKSIHILKADKGNATVILNRTDYDKKMLALLNTPTYKELKRDPTASIERKIIEII